MQYPPKYFKPRSSTVDGAIPHRAQINWLLPLGRNCHPCPHKSELDAHMRTSSLTCIKNMREQRSWRSVVHIDRQMDLGVIVNLTQPSNDEVVIQVHAAGVNFLGTATPYMCMPWLKTVFFPLYWTARRYLFSSYYLQEIEQQDVTKFVDSASFPRIPGLEGAGVVVQCGPSTSMHDVGDEVLFVLFVIIANHCIAKKCSFSSRQRRESRKHRKRTEKY